MSHQRPSTLPDWMEMIRIRTDPSPHNGVEHQIMDHLEAVRHSPDAPRIVVRRHLSVANDLMVVLQWSVAPEAAGSSLAYSLCRAFEAYGMVDHTVWSPDCLGERLQS